MLANCYVGPCVLEAGRQPVEADSDALDLACRLLNVHRHLLSVLWLIRAASRARVVVCDGVG